MAKLDASDGRDRPARRRLLPDPAAAARAAADRLRGRAGVDPGRGHAVPRLARAQRPSRRRLSSPLAIGALLILRGVVTLLVAPRSQLADARQVLVELLRFLGVLVDLVVAQQAPGRCAPRSRSGSRRPARPRGSRGGSVPRTQIVCFQGNPLSTTSSGEIWMPTSAKRCSHRSSSPCLSARSPTSCRRGSGSGRPRRPFSGSGRCPRRSHAPCCGRSSSWPTTTASAPPCVDGRGNVALRLEIPQSLRSRRRRSLREILAAAATPPASSRRGSPGRPCASSLWLR